MEKILVPVALFVYNRPKHLERTLKCLQNNHLAKKSDLFVFSDGAKTARDNEKVRQVREIIGNVSGFKSVNIILRDKNMGLANSIIDGVTTLIEKYGKAIIMEDDLESSPYLLQYFNDALELYAENEKIMHIGAYMFPINPTGLSESFFFRVATSWGWATWARAWKYFEPDIEKLFCQFDREKISAFSIDRTENFWKQINEFRTGKNDSWAIRWYASIFLNNGLALHPAISMTNNIGNDASGTHTDETNMYATTISDKPITEFPVIVEENSESYERIKYFFRTRKGNLLNRGLTFMRTTMRRFRI